ncbi:MAG: hypothetical protein AMXMBFR83_12270 [Phycisphaerae bacterium]
MAWILAGGLLASCGCGFDVQALDRFLLRPWPPSEQTPADFGQTFEDVRFPSANGAMISAWFVPAQNGTARGTFLVHTGMEGNIGRFMPLLVAGAERDFNVLVYDWQGFGASEGIKDFRNFEHDTHAALGYLRSRPEPSCRKIIHTGISLGCLPAVAITALEPDDAVGLILYGPFFPHHLPPLWVMERANFLLVPFAAVAGGWWAALLPPFMLPEPFFDDLRVPILLITPSDDTIVPPSEQDLFYQALPEPKSRYFTFGGHTRAPERDPELFTAITGWSRQLPGLLPGE